MEEPVSIGGGQKRLGSVMPVCGPDVRQITRYTGNLPGPTCPSRPTPSALPSPLPEPLPPHLPRHTHRPRIGDQLGHLGPVERIEPHMDPLVAQVTPARQGELLRLGLHRGRAELAR